MLALSTDAMRSVEVFPTRSHTTLGGWPNKNASCRKSESFETIVPVLVGLGVLMVVVGPAVQRRTRRRSMSEGSHHVGFWLQVGVFLIGQVLEGYVLSPKLVGPKVGLHPVWMMFALIAAAYLFGFVGLLVAIPLAATVGVLLRFALRKYLESPIYTGRDVGPGDLGPR